EVLQFTSIGVSDELKDPKGHALLQLDWRPRTDVALIGRVRTIDGELANEHLQLRSRYKQVTNLVFDLIHRRDNDWRWDPSVTTTDPLAAKRWLDLGPSVPRLLISTRAGTLIKENVDVLVRGALASDLSNSEPGDPPVTTWNASYFELGGALEVRLRRTIAV